MCIRDSRKTYDFTDRPRTHDEPRSLRRCSKAQATPGISGHVHRNTATDCQLGREDRAPERKALQIHVCESERGREKGRREDFGEPRAHGLYRTKRWLGQEGMASEGGAPRAGVLTGIASRVDRELGRLDEQKESFLWGESEKAHLSLQRGVPSVK